jgi:hypothetical protein
MLPHRRKPINVGCRKNRAGERPRPNLQNGCGAVAPIAWTRAVKVYCSFPPRDIESKSSGRSHHS